MTSTGSMPPSRSATPKVKRLTPETGSVPTVAIISPTTRREQPLDQRAAGHRGDDAEAENAEAK